MSTRSFIGLTAGDGWKDGIYVHSDGYPTGRGPDLFAMLEQRDGDLQRLYDDLAQAPGGWSALYPEGPKPDHVSDDAWVSGVGYKLSDSDEPYLCDWQGGVLNTDTEWIYAIDIERRTLSIFDVERLDRDLPDHEPFDSKPVLVAVARFDDPQPDWTRIECGAQYERCSHYAWVHFPVAEGTRLGIATFLERMPLSLNDAIGVIDEQGQRWVIGGSGYLERNGRDYTNRWFSSAHLEADPEVQCDIHTRWSNSDEPVRGLTYIYPPTISQVAA